MRGTRFLLAILVLVACLGCDMRPSVVRYDIELRVSVPGDAPDAQEWDLEAEAELLEPWTVYEGQCDRVLQVPIDAGVVSTQRVAEQLPMVISAGDWKTDFSFEPTKGYPVRLVGSGWIRDAEIGGEWKYYTVSSKGEEHIKYSARFEGKRRE